MNHMHSKVWYKITRPFPNVNGASYDWQCAKLHIKHTLFSKIQTKPLNVLLMEIMLFTWLHVFVIGLYHVFI